MDKRYIILGALMLIIGLLYFFAPDFVLMKKFRGDERVKPYTRKLGLLFGGFGVVFIAWAFFAEQAAANKIYGVIFMLLCAGGAFLWIHWSRNFAAQMQAEENTKKLPETKDE